MKIVTATVVDVEKALDAFKAAVSVDPSLEGLAGKKLASAVELILPKDGVSKDLNQAFNHGENWWAKNVLNGDLEGCTRDNRLDKIKQHVCQSPSYIRHMGVPSTKVKVERWLEETFPALT